MADPARARRVADRIHKTVAQVLERRIKDPRLGFVTITDVRVTGDLQQATVFYTVYGTEGERRRSASALKSATGLIRSEVGKALGIRLTPTISFQLDSLPTTARSIEDALAQAQARDAAIARAAEGASYAGDANPYRTKDEDEDATSSDSAESAASPEEAMHEQDVFADEQEGGVDNRQIAALQAQAMAEAAQADAESRSSHDQL
ncbi:ribosome-binding factor A [Actinomyces graevenitzii F0530]|jgi:ribosome-binding factor A|uniref:Ribosome-binding factor A n=1 Tax=Actinomyces graevenitzii F0530 TaxID=1321817 RepID=U1Q1U6_9ACTO|nr:ribosome-binding factor A [Actinomyces graevenitzii F0530]